VGDIPEPTANTLKGPPLPVILFVCTANQFRSPIAAACFSRRLVLKGMENNWTVLSAGTWTSTGLPAHPKAMEAAAKLGLDLKPHRTRVVDSALLHAADLIIVMQAGHKEALETEFPIVHSKVFLLGDLSNIPGGEIADPAEENFSHSEETARFINSCISKAFALLVQFAYRNQNEQQAGSNQDN
jgi:protein-tyrosine phosphatase